MEREGRSQLLNSLENLQFHRRIKTNVNNHSSRQAIENLVKPVNVRTVGVIRSLFPESLLCSSSSHTSCSTKTVPREKECYVFFSKVAFEGVKMEKSTLMESRDQVNKQVFHGGRRGGPWDLCVSSVSGGVLVLREVKLPKFTSCLKRKTEKSVSSSDIVSGGRAIAASVSKEAHSY